MQEPMNGHADTSAEIAPELSQKKKDKKAKSDAEKEKKRKIKHDQEQKALTEMKLRIKDLKRPKYHDDDAALLRFIRARRCDVDKATRLFEDCVKWREQYKPEAITLEQIPREASSGKAYPLGKDKQRRPSWLIIPARHEPKNSDNEECVRALVFYVEQALSQMDADVEQMSLMIDFEGWGLKNRDHDLDKMLIDTIQNYYPERLGQCFLVNAPTVFKVAWAVVRPWLDKRTTNKLQFVSSSEMSTVLLQHFDADVLPTKYGGKNAINLEKKAVAKGPPKGMSMTK